MILGDSGFSNSIIGARACGQLTFGAIATSKNYIEFGVAAHHVGRNCDDVRAI
jgi:hypothetical protein